MKRRKGERRGGGQRMGTVWKNHTFACIETMSNFCFHEKYGKTRIIEIILKQQTSFKTVEKNVRRTKVYDGAIVVSLLHRKYVKHWNFFLVSYCTTIICFIIRFIKYISFVVYVFISHFTQSSPFRSFNVKHLNSKCWFFFLFVGSCSLVLYAWLVFRTVNCNGDFH